MPLLQLSCRLGLDRTHTILGVTNLVHGELHGNEIHCPRHSCEGCAGTIKKALGAIPGVSSVSVDVATKAVTIDHGEEVPRAAIDAALKGVAIPRQTFGPAAATTEGFRPPVWRESKTRSAVWRSTRQRRLAAASFWV